MVGHKLTFTVIIISNKAREAPSSWAGKALGAIMQPSQQDCNAHRAKALSNISLETEVLFMILCYLVLRVRMYYFLATFVN